MIRHCDPLYAFTLYVLQSKAVERAYKVRRQQLINRCATDVARLHSQCNVNDLSLKPRCLFFGTKAHGIWGVTCDLRETRDICTVALVRYTGKMHEETRVRFEQVHTKRPHGGTLIVVPCLALVKRKRIYTRPLSLKPSSAFHTSLDIPARDLQLLCFYHLHFSWNGNASFLTIFISPLLSA